MFGKAATTLHLGIAFDQNYVQHFYALFTSVLQNNPANKVVVHAIITGLSTEAQQEINRYAAQHGADIHFYSIDEARVQQFVVSNHWSAAAYYRLFFPLIVPASVTRLLYLDTDIVVVNDLAPLFRIDLEHYPVAAVYDNWVKTAPQLGITEEGNYFNSGVMLIDVPEWKRRHVSEKVFDYLRCYPERINYVDQCGLNAVLINSWKKLDWKFNVLHSRIPEGMSRKEQRQFLKDKYIIHYTLDRPWKMLCRNPFRRLYHRYLSQSPFKPKQRYIDYSVYKLPHFLKIKLIELYFDMPVVKAAWRKLKVKRIEAA